LPLGGEWTTRRRTITQADLSAFVGLSGDYNPLYTDIEHARSGPFGEPVVPGTLVAAVTTGLGAIDVPVPATVGLVGTNWRFLRPVRPGDTIGSRWRLNRKRPVENPRWGLAVWHVEVENQRGEMVATGEVTRLVGRREQPVEAGRSSKSRRRRRRAAEVAANHELPSKPTPGPLVEPAFKPAAEPQVPEPEVAAAVAPPGIETPPSRRRRRSGKPRPEVRPEQPVAEQPVPERPVPEPAAAEQAWSPPPPAPPAEHPSPFVVAPPPAPEAETPPPAPPAAPAPHSRRRRRSRGAVDQAELALNQPGPATAPAEPEREPDAVPPPAEGASETPEDHPEPPGYPSETSTDYSEDNASASGLAGVLRRLRGF